MQAPFNKQLLVPFRTLSICNHHKSTGKTAEGMFQTVSQFWLQWLRVVYLFYISWCLCTFYDCVILEMVLLKEKHTNIPAKLSREHVADDGA